MKKRKKVAAKKPVKRVSAMPRKSEPASNLPYRIHEVGKNFEIRNPSKKEVLGPYSTRLAAENAAKILNRLPRSVKTKSSVLE